MGRKYGSNGGNCQYELADGLAYDLYGTTLGNPNPPTTYGTVFKITP